MQSLTHTEAPGTGESCAGDALETDFCLQLHCVRHGMLCTANGEFFTLLRDIGMAEERDSSGFQCHIPKPRMSAWALHNETRHKQASCNLSRPEWLSSCADLPMVQPTGSYPCVLQWAQPLLRRFVEIFYILKEHPLPQHITFPEGDDLICNIHQFKHAKMMLMCVWCNPRIPITALKIAPDDCYNRKGFFLYRFTRLL